MTDTNKTQGQYLTTAQVAEIYQVKEQTLVKWRHKGEGPRYARIGKGEYGPVRYLRADVDNFLRFVGDE